LAEQERIAANEVASYTVAIGALMGTSGGRTSGWAGSTARAGKAENLAKTGSRTVRFPRAEPIEITRFASKSAIRLVLAYRIRP